MKCDDVDINTGIQIEGKTPLFLACENGYSSVVEVLLNVTDIDINKGRHQWQSLDKAHSGYTPLMAAIHYNFTEIAGMLLQHPKIDLNKETLKGHTALVVAAINDNLEMIKILVQDNRTDINKGEITPLGITCKRLRRMYINLDAFRYLIKPR